MSSFLLSVEWLVIVLLLIDIIMSNTRWHSRRHDTEQASLTTLNKLVEQGERREKVERVRALAHETYLRLSTFSMQRSKVYPNYPTMSKTFAVTLVEPNWITIAVTLNEGGCTISKEILALQFSLEEHGTVFCRRTFNEGAKEEKVFTDASLIINKEFLNWCQGPISDFAPL